MQVSDILRVKGGTLFTVAPDEALSAALDIMSQHDIGSLVVMDHGKIVAHGSPRSLITQYSTREVLELRFDTDDHAEHGEAIAGIGERIEVLPDRLLVYTKDGDAAAAEVHLRGVRPLSALVRRSTLEDVFLHLTGRTLVD